MHQLSQQVKTSSTFSLPHAAAADHTFNETQQTAGAGCSVPFRQLCKNPAAASQPSRRCRECSLVRYNHIPGSDFSSKCLLAFIRPLSCPKSSDQWWTNAGPQLNGRQSHWNPPLKVHLLCSPWTSASRPQQCDEALCLVKWTAGAPGPLLE